MIRSIRVAESAAAELAEAVRWHERQRAGLGRDLKDVVASVVRMIAARPEVGSRVASRSKRILRRRLTPRFPYQLIDYVDRGAVVVVAVAHTSRRPSYWKDRLLEKS